MRARNSFLYLACNISSLFKSRLNLHFAQSHSPLARESPPRDSFERGSIPRNYVTFNVKKSATWLWPTAVANSKYARNPCLPSLREMAPTSVPGVYTCIYIEAIPGIDFWIEIPIRHRRIFFLRRVVARAHDSRIPNTAWPRSSLNFDRAAAAA